MNNSNPVHTRYKYLRDRNNVPHSCIAIQVDREDNLINYQVVTLSSKDTASFVKKTARHIATKRLEHRPLQISAEVNTLSGHEIARLIMEDISKNGDHYVADTTLSANNELALDKMKLVKGVPQRTRNAAKKWLKDYSVNWKTLPSMKTVEVSDNFNF